MGEILEQIVQVPVSRNRFRDLQQKSQAIALVAQLELDGTIAFVVQDIVNRDRDLLHDEVEELQVRVVDGMRARRAESIAPSGRTVVVSGSMQKDSTPSAWTSDAAVGKRSASSCDADDDGLLRGQRETAERRGRRALRDPAESDRRPRRRACAPS